MSLLLSINNVARRDKYNIDTYNQTRYNSKVIKIAKYDSSVKIFLRLAYNL